MKTLVIAVVAAVGTIASPAFAAFDRYGNYYDSRTSYDSRDVYRRADTARVVSSQPVYSAAGTREECWNPREGRYQDRSEASGDSNRVAGTALGAIAGGVIGHQIGDNNAGTIAGAILGGIAGNQIERRVQEDRNDLDLSTCRTVAAGPEALQGYDVTYEYRGQQYTTRMASAPGQFLRLGSDIRDDGLPYDNAVAYAPGTYEAGTYEPGTYNVNPPYNDNNNPYGSGG